MDFQQFLQQSKKQLEQVEENYFQQWKKQIEKINPELLNLLDLFIEANKGGKKIRGSLVRLGYKLFANEKTDSIDDCAIAYEIFQTAILAHDDIIDKSDLRRGRETLFKKLGGDHYAISQTICLGDIGFFLANQIIAESGFSSDKKAKALGYFNNAMAETVLGEILDIDAPLKNKIDKNMINQIYTYKTARYTFVGPLQMGAILAGASDNKLEIIKKFGDALGIAFQIQDDILGVFGSEKELGKSVTSDVEEGKATLLIAFAKENGSEADLKHLEKSYGKGIINNEDFEKVKQIFTKTGALDQAQAEAVQYVVEAKKLIPQITEKNEYQNLLVQMADFLVERKK